MLIHSVKFDKRKINITYFPNSDSFTVKGGTINKFVWRRSISQDHTKLNGIYVHLIQDKDKVIP